MHINRLSLNLPVLAILALAAGPTMAQQDDSTPWNPEAVPPQAVFDYGAKTEPTLVCAPSKYCGLALETGEIVQSAQANEDDWSVTPTTFGAGKLAKPVVLVSPYAPGVKDELTITTTAANGQARTYKVMLLGDPDNWTQLTSYRYPVAQ